jgi:short-subunit dehydrogenase
MKDTGGYFRDKATLVTGASSGIGQELAWQLGQSGAKLTLAARRRELLESLAERIASTGTMRPLVGNCDVTRNGDRKSTTWHWLWNKWH